MIGKSFLGESLNFPIGQLKLSYRRIFSITGESLVEVSSGLRRGGLFGIFYNRICDETAVFLNNFVFVLMHLRVFLRDQPYGVVIFSGLRGSVDAVRQHCPAKRLTPMGLLAE